MRSRLVVVIAAAALATVAAGCGDDDDQSQSTAAPPATQAATTGPEESAADDGTLARIKEAGVLRVGVGIYAPTAAETSSGELVGVDIEVTNRIADALGVEVEHIPTGFDVIAAGVQTGRWDMTTSIVESAERAEAVSFSDPLYTVDQLFLVKADSPYETIEDLNDPSVTVVEVVGSYGEQVINSFLPNAGRRTLTTGTNVQQLFELLSGRADAMPIETPFTTRRVFNEYGDDVRLVPGDGSSLQSDPVSYGLPKDDPEFEAFVNDLLAEMTADGTIDELFDRFTLELLGPLEDEQSG